MNKDEKRALAESLDAAIKALVTVSRVLSDDDPEESDPVAVEKSAKKKPTKRPQKSRKTRKPAGEPEVDRILDGEIDDARAGAILVRPEPVIFTGSLAVQARKAGQLKNAFIDDPRVGREYAQSEREKKQYIPAEPRPKKQQISVTCSVCSRNFKVYPSELSVSIGEQGESPLFVCNRCSRHR